MSPFFQGVATRENDFATRENDFATRENDLAFFLPFFFVEWVLLDKWYLATYTRKGGDSSTGVAHGKTSTFTCLYQKPLIINKNAYQSSD